MTSQLVDISPDEIGATAAAATEACAGLGIRDIARKLGGDGLIGILSPETAGGLGLPLKFSVPVVSKCASGLLPFPIIESLLLARLVAPRDAELAGQLVSGASIATIAWRGLARVNGSGQMLSVSGICDRAPQASRCDHVLVFLASGGAALVATAQDALKITDAIALAIDTPENVLTIDGARLPSSLVFGATEIADLRRDALILQAASCVGAGDAALAMAVEHVSTRRQFGKPLVANQAIRHLLARHKLQLEGARSAIERCFMTPEMRDLHVHSAFTASVVAGIAATEGAIQLHGGMGYTWDVPLHRHLRNIRAASDRGDITDVRNKMAHALVDANDIAV